MLWNPDYAPDHDLSVEQQGLALYIYVSLKYWLKSFVISFLNPQYFKTRTTPQSLIAHTADPLKQHRTAGRVKTGVNRNTNKKIISRKLENKFFSCINIWSLNWRTAPEAVSSTLSVMYTPCCRVFCECDKGLNVCMLHCHCIDTLH